MRNLSKPSLKYERALWEKGFLLVAGVDEVGRGAWAGPVVASAVAFAPQIKNLKFKMQNFEGIKINDSKKLKPRERERADKWIKSNCMAWGIGEVGSGIINRLGMARATKMTFRKAIINCRKKIDFLLIDAFYIPYVNGVRRKNQLAIIDGDQKSFSIAAASILAKVYRDKLMQSLSRQAKYKKYSWGRNKGYGTREHQEAIKRHGVTKMHRKQFVETWESKCKTQSAKRKAEA